MKTGNVRRRTLPPLVLAALLLAGMPGAAAAAPAAGVAGGGVQAGELWERVWGWVVGLGGPGLTALWSEEGSMIDPNGSKTTEPTPQGIDALRPEEPKNGTSLND